MARFLIQRSSNERLSEDRPEVLTERASENAPPRRLELRSDGERLTSGRRQGCARRSIDVERPRSVVTSDRREPGRGEADEVRSGELELKPAPARGDMDRR